MLTYALDGDRPLASDRGRVPVPATAKPEWIGATPHKEWRIEVHAGESGVHSLKLTALAGEIAVDRIALTLYFGGKPKGDTIDHTGDPGGGRAEFPDHPDRPDGYRPGWISPPVRATRSFHVDDRAGRDTADGLTPATAWKTLAKVNTRTWKPGDAILLRRGGEWKGGLAPKGSGTPEAPITLGAYGEGPRPALRGATGDGIAINDLSWWTIQDLEISGASGSGLAAHTVFGRPQPKGLKVFNVLAWDNGPAGIEIGCEYEKGNGWDGVLVENCVSWAHDSDGIVVHGADQNGCRNTVIRYCTAWSNLHAGGIWIFAGQNGLIENCLAYNNACINIWAWNARNITIRRCEAFRGRTPRDAGGFDIDWGCQGCTLEYCYSHHNEGVGILLMGGGDGDYGYRNFPLYTRHNLCRFCVTENDNPGLGLTETWQFGIVHNCLAIADGKDRTAIDLSGWPLMKETMQGGGWPEDSLFLNNIFVGLHGATVCAVDDHAATDGRNRFDGNLYWRDTPGALVLWGGRKNGNKWWEGNDKSTDLAPAMPYDSLDAFRRATGHETHGVNTDPAFANPYRGEYVRLPLDSYGPKPGAPVRPTGVPVVLSPEWLAARAKFLADTGAEAYGIPMSPAPATEDFWGHSLGTSPPIGPGL